LNSADITRIAKRHAFWSRMFDQFKKSGHFEAALASFESASRAWNEYREARR
jgi:hypothetical protein